MNICKTLIEMMVFFLLALAAMTLPAMGATTRYMPVALHEVAIPASDGRTDPGLSMDWRQNSVRQPFTASDAID